MELMSFNVEGGYMSTVLITVATGFLGGYLVGRFEKEGFHVKAVGRNEKIGKELESKNVKFVKADITEESKMIDSCRDVDFVVHAGALSTVWGNYQKFYDANVIGTKNMIAACKQNGVKEKIGVRAE